VDTPKPSKHLPFPTENGDHETLHIEEDDALWQFVTYCYLTSTNTGIRREAEAFLEWADKNKDRERWYA